jgi:hypothetical protein
VADNPEGTDVVSDETLKGAWATSENGDGVLSPSPRPEARRGIGRWTKGTKDKPTTSESSRFSGNGEIVQGKDCRPRMSSQRGGIKAKLPQAKKV